MTVTGIPAASYADTIVWPTPAERAEFLTVGMDDHTLARMPSEPVEDAAFDAKYLLRWGANPGRVARALYAATLRGAA